MMKQMVAASSVGIINTAEPTDIQTVVGGGDPLSKINPSYFYVRDWEPAKVEIDIN